jgi:vanillate/3-O-methylgallate O-demethylase
VKIFIDKNHHGAPSHIRDRSESSGAQTSERNVMTAPISLEDKIATYKNPADMLRRSPMGWYPFPIPSEISNWRDEERAWATTATLFDQGFHMTDVYFKGPDVKKLLSYVATNNFASFGADKAKQLVTVNHDGHVIADAIVFGWSEDEYSIVGTPIASNWVAYNAEVGGYDVEIVRDEAMMFNKTGRRLTFRLQLQGPSALKIVQKAAGGTLPEIKFFNIGRFTIAGRPVRALNHTMVGVPGLEHTGLEVFGPIEYREEVKQALLEAGEEFGMREGGELAYSATAIESGWIPLPVPAIYTGEAMEPYRRHLGADSMEANASLGGSYVSEQIEDYYCLPWDLGYGRSVHLEHDFIGRDALVRQKEQPHRTKVWLRWNDDDVTATMRDSLFGEGTPTKFMKMPTPLYSLYPYDSVLLNGEPVGVSTLVSYTVNQRGFGSLAMLDSAAVQDGAEVVVVWGEPNGGTGRPGIERHRQAEIRATVSTTSLVGDLSNAKG